MGTFQKAEQWRSICNQTANDSWLNLKSLNLSFHKITSVLFRRTKKKGKKDRQKRRFLTCDHSQSNLVFVVIEPAWNFHAASICSRVYLLHPPDGQGHVALLEIPLQQVPLWLPAADGRPIWLDHLISAASAGDGPPAPADGKLSVVFDVIFTVQSHIGPHCGDHAVCRHTAWKQQKNSKKVDQEFRKYNISELERLTEEETKSKDAPQRVGSAPKDHFTSASRSTERLLSTCWVTLSQAAVWFQLWTASRSHDDVLDALAQTTCAGGRGMLKRAVSFSPLLVP